MSGFVSRGFKGRRRSPEEVAARPPPGQYAEPGFPVLTAGPTPLVDTDACGGVGRLSSVALGCEQRD